MAHEPQGLTRKHIPDNVWKWLSARTSFGTSIFDCIKGAVKYPQGPGVGLVAPGKLNIPQILERF